MTRQEMFESYFVGIVEEEEKLLEGFKADGDDEYGINIVYTRGVIKGIKNMYGSFLRFIFEMSQEESEAKMAELLEASTSLSSSPGTHS